MFIHQQCMFSISGQEFKGCHMNQPYYVQSEIYIDTETTFDLLTRNYTLHWNDLLSIWGIGNYIGANSYYAYCTQSNLANCNKRWIIYDDYVGESVLDSVVQSGYCDSYVGLFILPNQSCLQNFCQYNYILSPWFEISINFDFKIIDLHYTQIVSKVSNIMKSVSMEGLLQIL